MVDDEYDYCYAALLVITTTTHVIAAIKGCSVQNAAHEPKVGKMFVSRRATPILFLSQGG